MDASAVGHRRRSLPERYIVNQCVLPQNVMKYLYLVGVRLVKVGPSLTRVYWTLA